MAATTTDGGLCYVFKITSAEKSESKPDDSSLELPPPSFLGMWKQDRYSDVHIKIICSTKCSSLDEAAALPGCPVVTSTTPSALASSASTPTTTATIHREFPAHKMALEAGSTYFKGLFTTGQSIAQEPAATKASVEAQTDTAEQGPQVIYMFCESEEDADAIESVFKFIYTHTLPAFPNVGMLCKMMISAEYLGADLCVQACAFGLSKLPLSDDHAMLKQVFEVLKHCSACNAEVAARIQSACFDCLNAKYGNVFQIINSRDLLLSFCNLPLGADIAWCMGAEFEFEGEETALVLLLNKWWHSQSEQVRTDESKVKLSSLVKTLYARIDEQLHVLDSFEWFLPQAEDPKVAE